ncbi:ABC transporter permease, partial [Rhodococcus hoagii]|nr:ABC transporter permease [Prescottella equi]
MVSGFTGVVVGLQGFAPPRHSWAVRPHRLPVGVRQTPARSPRSSRRWRSATVGCGFTAQLGAMRISEEIDA